MKRMCEARFKKMVKVKICEFALDQLNEEKFSHSKMDNLVFTELKLQDYLISEKMTVKQKRNIFLFRVRMADYGENYPNRSILPIPCRMCHLHRDCQAHSVSCQETMNNIRTRGNYNEIFSNSISEDTAIMIEEILETRRKQAEPS